MFALGVAKTRGSGVGQVQTIKGGLHGDIAKGKEKRQEIANRVGEGTESKLLVMGSQQGNAAILENESPTLTEANGTAGNNRPVLMYYTDTTKSSASIAQTGCASARLANETDTITAGGGHRWASTPLVLNGCGSKNIMLEDEAMTLTNNGVRTGYGMLATIQNVCIPLDTMSLDERRDKSNACSIGNDGDPSPTIGVTHHHAVGAVQGNVAVVRQLTPVECERLQGFPDNYTRIAWRGRSEEKCPNSLQYKALGNSMAVPCMKFIGERVQELEEALKGCGGQFA